jgi:hypothetical protein
VRYLGPPTLPLGSGRLNAERGADR